MPSPAVRWIKEQCCFVSVLLVMAVGIVSLFVAGGHWVRSTAIMGGAMLVAAVLRAFVPEDRVGSLRVRARWLDTVFYLAAGGLVLAMDIRLHH